MLRRASLTVLFVVLLPATVHAFDHHHRSGSSSSGGCSSSSSSSSSTPPSVSATATRAPTAVDPDRKRVFVTSTTYSGALGGLDAADQHCQSSASAAGLPGVYRAWVSDRTANAADRITSDGPWYTTGDELAFSSKDDLRGSPASAILSEHGGNPVGPGASGAWTGTDANGVATGEDCEGWTNATVDAVATTGTALALDPSWGSGDSPLSCNDKAALICFQQ